MLLTSLDPAAVAAGHDLAGAVRIDGVTLSRSDLVGAGTSVAERVSVARRVAILATPSATTVLAITGCLIAGVPFVPVPADVGATERAHIPPIPAPRRGWVNCPPKPKGCRIFRCGCTPGPGTATPNRHPIRRR